MFRAADLTLITKTDLLAYITEFSPGRARAALRQVGFAGETIELSNRGGDGFAAWLGWLEREVAGQRSRALAGESVRPSIQPEGAAAHAAGDRPPR
jgi:hydrogenase nickel incorporation protein HypB